MKSFRKQIDLVETTARNLTTLKIAYNETQMAFWEKKDDESKVTASSLVMLNALHEEHNALKDWAIEKQNVIKERNSAKTKEERDRLTAILDYMGKVEMAVIISEDADENEKFSKQGLDIATHRTKMNAITPDGKDIEDRFKDINDPLQLVFVCAMWLTGFDVPNLSTLYLDKPMKGHTLMQAIARANRVYPGKSSGMVVDYVNVFKYMKKALSEYATGDDGTEYPAKDIDKLIGYIDATIVEADDFLQSMSISLDKIIGESNTLDKLDELRCAYDTIVAKDQGKEQFKVILNTLMNLYEASKPEVFEKKWFNEKFAPLVYLHGLFYRTIDDEKVARARLRMSQLLDSSVTAESDLKDEQEIVIYQSKVSAAFAELYCDAGFIKRLRKCHDQCMRELNEVLKTVITSLSITAVIAIITIATAGALSGPIAVALVGSNFAGLSGAALTSACLAYLGGGAIAVGGAGMLGGTIAIVGGGAALGIGVGAGIGGAVGAVGLVGKKNTIMQSAKLLTSVSNKGKQDKREPLTFEEQSIFMKFLEFSPAYKHWLNILTVLLGTGMRIGECLGLTWHNCDFEDNTIEISNRKLKVCKAN